jgi:hypothetical protein
MVVRRTVFDRPAAEKFALSMMAENKNGPGEKLAGAVGFTSVMIADA